MYFPPQQLYNRTTYWFPFFSSGIYYYINFIFKNIDICYIFYCLLNKITVIHRHILRLFYLLLLLFGGFSIFFFIFLAPSKTGRLLKMIPPPPSAESKTSPPPSTSDKKDSKVDESKSTATTSKVPVKAA